MVKAETGHITPLKSAADYHMWSVQMEVLFESEGLLKIVTGQTTLAATPLLEQPKWKTDDALAKNYIFATTDNLVRQHILTCTSSAAMYSLLKGIFKKDTEQEKCALYSELFSLQFDPSVDMLQNTTKVRTIAHRLRALKETISEGLEIYWTCCHRNI